MTKRELENYRHMMAALESLGFDYQEREQLRRISMTLHRWHELECGDGNEYGSWAIERDDNGDGPPFMVHHHYRHGQGKDTVTRWRIPDRETGARKRLSAIIAKHPQLSAFVQTDPRGAALYILRPGDVPEGGNADSYYTRGICVY
jgi:hypothetical protein